MSIKDGNFLHSNKNINLHNFFSRYLGININRSIFSCKSDYEILHNIYKQIKKNKSVVLHDENYIHKKFVNLYDLHSAAIYVGAVETQNYLDKSVINLIKFSITDGKKINLENNFANITICYLSLHHFISIDAMMDEIVYLLIMFIY
jgi:hypothetical protein